MVSPCLSLLLKYGNLGHLTAQIVQPQVVSASQL